MFRKIALAIAVAAAGLVTTAVTSQSASAQGLGYGSSCSHNEYVQPIHVCKYKTVLTYKWKRVPVRKRIVKYYSCGTPYYAWKTYWKTIRVPVYRRVKICGCH